MTFLEVALIQFLMDLIGVTYWNKRSFWSYGWGKPASFITGLCYRSLNF